MFVERCGTLQGLLARVSNRYIHYGDIDLAGIHIYQVQYVPIVGERGSFFLPCEVDELFKRFKGLSELFEQQKRKYAALQGIDESMQILIDEIRIHKKGIEQESFIE